MLKDEKIIVRHHMLDRMIEEREQILREQSVNRTLKRILESKILNLKKALENRR